MALPAPGEKSAHYAAGSSCTHNIIHTCPGYTVSAPLVEGQVVLKEDGGGHESQVMLKDGEGGHDAGAQR